MPDYRQTYSAMNDDELLNLAAQQGSLLPEAQWALTSVLAERRLSSNDVEEQSQWREQAEFEQDYKDPLSFSFHGFGTDIYGKRDFKADGSFITTKWIILFLIPLVPLKSFRIAPINEARHRFSFLSLKQYRIIDEFRPNLRQVAFIYAYEIVLICAVSRLLFTMGSLTVFYAIVALWACVPWLLRRISKI
jgi:hypothetical protein